MMMVRGKGSVIRGALACIGLASNAWAAQQVQPQAPARADLTGHWVAQITEDWRWRMMTPPKGDIESVPLNAAGTAVASNWDLDRDNANGDQCKAFGAAAIMRQPTRVRITWSDDQTLRVETDAGQQTRAFNFGKSAYPPAERTWQGHSLAEWMRPLSSGPGASYPPGGLKVVTTHLRDGYLRKNGVPYSGDAVVTEYYHLMRLYGTDYLQVLTIVEDPVYLLRPFVVSNHFKREPDGSKWNPTPCVTDPPVVAEAPPSAFE